MDIDQKDTRLDELREALRQTNSEASLKSCTFEINPHYEQLTLDLTGLNDLHINTMNDWATTQISALATDQISALDSSSLTIGIGAISGGGGAYTVNQAISASSKIKIDGPDADIEINGESVVGVLKDIRDRLAMIKVSEEMEAEWQELRDLREQYEAKLEECRQKSAAWQALQKMPAPELDV
jgi:hypothetical protein